jgi:hypothetical protein
LGWLEHQELPGLQGQGAKKRRLQPHDLPGEAKIKVSSDNKE